MKLLSIELDALLDGALKGNFSDNNILIFSRYYLPEDFDPYDFVSDIDLSPHEEEIFNHASLCFKAELSAKRLIARAEQHSMGLRSKLISRGFGSSIAKIVVSSLQERCLLDDERYGVLWLQNRISSSSAYSPKKLLFSLRNKGISRDDANNAMKKVMSFDTEYALLDKYIKKNKLLISQPDLKYSLSYEGFSRDTLNEFFDENT